MLQQQIKYMLFCTLLLTLMLSSQAAAPIQAQSFSCNFVSELPLDECDDLVILYNSTHGPSWYNKTGWLTTNTPCSWHGITCSEGHVTEIMLSVNNLTGNVPDLPNLSQLTYLYLNHNRLTGNIPNFTHLPNLTKLYLSENQLTGNIPNFANLPQLEDLNLPSNQLTGSIPNFTNLPQLRNLAIGDNQLSGGIPNFTNLPHLTNLYLSENQLLGSVPNFTNLLRLIYLKLDHNQLSGTIPNFSNMPRLITIILDHNQLSGTIPTFTNLPTLLTLNLDYNLLSGTIPNLNWSRFTSLTLNSNCGLVAYDVAQAGVLANLDLNWQQRHPICQNLPTATPNVPMPTATPTVMNTPFAYSCSRVTEIPQVECEELVTLYNSTSGAIWWDNTNWLITNTPCSWGRVTCSGGHVSQIDLHFNHLVGTLPNFANLPSLVKIDLSSNWLYNNQFNGAIPNFTNLPNLVELYLYSNHLSGTIPDFTNLSHLTNLDLTHNFLVGTIPNSNWSRLNYFHLNHNCGLVAYNVAQASVLQDKDPFWQEFNPVCATTPTPRPMPTVTNTPSPTPTPTVINTPLPFSCNNVTEIPQTECEDLVTLYNSTNGVNWTYGNWLLTNTPCSAWYPLTCKDGHVTKIELTNNGLTGTIPDLSHLPYLTTLYFSNNHLTGSIPNFSNLPRLEYLSLDGNQLTGTIPNFNLPRLQFIIFIGNQLSGNIPNFTNLPHLQALYLNRNQLTGTIPNFTNLPDLLTLSLTHNELTGNIPNFTNLSSLTSLHLANNRLNGTLPNFNWSDLVFASLSMNCGLVAANAAQATVLDSLDENWQQLDPTCFMPPTPTHTPTTIPATSTATPTFTPTPTPTFIPTSTPTFTPTPTPYFISTIIPPTGGVFTSPDSLVRLQIPDGLMTDSLTLSINTLNKTIQLTDGFKLTSRLFEIIALDSQGQRVTQFNNPFTITFSYQDNAWLHLAPETDLSVYYWSELENRWVNLLPCEGCSQDTVNNRFIIQLNHLTQFAMLVVDKRQRVYLPVIRR